MTECLWPCRSWWRCFSFPGEFSGGSSTGHNGFALEIIGRPLTRKGWFVVGVFVITVLLWTTDQWHGLPAAVIALLPAIVFTASGLDSEDLKRIDWNVPILIAGGISLGAGMQMTGLDEQVVRLLPSGEATRNSLLPALVLLTIGLSTFMSNTAAANLLLPIGISSAALLGGTGGPAAQAAVSIVLAASLSVALPVSTPPNAIAYAAGGFATRDLRGVGLLVGAAGPRSSCWGADSCCGSEG